MCCGYNAAFVFTTRLNGSRMAHHKSAIKRIRQTERRTEANRARRSRIRTYVKKVEVAIASGDAKAAREALLAAQPELDRGVSKGVLAKNTVARKLSRLSVRVKALQS
jgi:small subunit ribosomal protein S20